MDLRKDPLDPDERARKNIREGKGVSIGGIVKGGKTSYEFSTSNPLWRATLDTLDFIPLATVDYSGGLVISDWYNDGNNANESLKIIVRFLSNEIKSNSLKIVVHQKKCINQNNCPTKVIESAISEELAKTIIVKAARLERASKEKK